MKTSFVCAALALPLVTLAAPTRYNDNFRLPAKLFRRQDNATCDLATTAQPSSSLTPPPADLSLVLIGLGKGTQNYTCASETATPAAIGAVAEIFNASCAVATGNMGTIAEDDGDEVGMHFFIDSTTPEFDIIGLGNTQAKKVQNATAPRGAIDVPWLRLEAIAGAGTTSAVKQIYRLNTEGGVAPATCAGQAPGSVVTVSYSAQYWIYADAAVVEQRRKRRSLGLPLN